MARVFICYRRTDSRWAAGRLYDRLVGVLGRDNVFLDVTDIEPGEDFVAKIEHIVGACDVLLALIGPDWDARAGAARQRRIESPNDFIRVEIATALKRNIRVIPILLDGAVMPAEHELPADLAALARRNALPVSFPHFHDDVDSFVRVLERVLARPKAGPSQAPSVATPEPTSPFQTAPAAPVVAEAPRVATLPHTIACETLGGIASPLIEKGAKLPAEVSVIYSTAADNQASVEVHLVFGERELARDNVRIGKFTLEGILPAARGVPKILVTATVDPTLMLTVTAEDKATNRKQILDAVDLRRLSPPLDDPGTTSFQSGNSANGAGTDRHSVIHVSAEKAKTGGTAFVKLDDNRTVKVKVPPGVVAGDKLRIRGGAHVVGAGTGDLYLEVVISPAAPA